MAARKGIDLSGTRVGAAGPYRTLKSSAYAVDGFRSRVQILDLIGMVNIHKIAAATLSILKSVYCD